METKRVKKIWDEHPIELVGNPVLLDPKHDTARISHEKLRQDEGEGHQMERSHDDSEDSDGDRRKHGVGARKVGYRENDEIPTGEDDDIDNGDALGSEGNRFPGFKFLGSSATKEGVHDTSGIKVSMIQALAGDLEQIRAMRLYRTKKKSATRTIPPIYFHRSIVANTPKALSLLRHMVVEDAALDLQNGLTDPRRELCSSPTPKWKRDDTNASTPCLWAKIQKLEAEVYPDLRKSG
ncbi:hypothetical protein HOY82DRAFT_622050 [Tuber indicum]|nr:hypothetical protein HOY82DRAFT_622050 [Tuber indicum]